MAVSILKMIDQSAPSDNDGGAVPVFSKLVYYSDIETSDAEDDHGFVPPPVTPELLATLLKQVS